MTIDGGSRLHFYHPPPSGGGSSTSQSNNCSQFVLIVTTTFRIMYPFPCSTTIITNLEGLSKWQPPHRSKESQTGVNKLFSICSNCTHHFQNLSHVPCSRTRETTREGRSRNNCSPNTVLQKKSGLSQKRDQPILVVIGSQNKNLLADFLDQFVCAARYSSRYYLLIH